MKDISKLFLSVIIILGCISCDRFLDEELTTQPTESFYRSVNGFENGVNSIYSILRKTLPGSPAVTQDGEAATVLTVGGTDLIWTGYGGNFRGISQYNNQLNPRNVAFEYYWKHSYQAINQANSIIAAASNGVDGMDGDLLKVRIGEARFLRSLVYFNLVRTFGPVSLVLEPSAGVQVQFNRNSEQEIFESGIIPDLEFSIANLPSVQADYGRVTKPAAQMLLAEVLITKSYSDFANSTDLDKAVMFLEEVIDNYDFKLLENFRDNFIPGNEKNKETIWSIQFNNDLILNEEGNGTHMLFLMPYDELPGMRRTIDYGRPWVRYRPTPYLLELWNREIDVRYEDTFRDVYYCNNESNIPSDALGNPKFQLGDTAVFLPGTEVSETYRNTKPYLILSPSEYNDRYYISIKKFEDPNRETVNQAEGTRDWVVMRLAETYLLLAEAYFQKGDLVESTHAINTVRERAAKKDKVELIKILPNDINLDFILEEYGRELVGEMKRWFLLKRTNTLIERVSKHNPEAASNIKSFHLNRPIPQSQIDRVDGDYGQNEGY